MRLMIFLLAPPLLLSIWICLAPLRVHSGDDLRYAQPDLNDRDWPTVTAPASLMLPS